MADETKENAQADSGTGRPAQGTAAPAAAAAAAALPWYKRPLFWSIVLLALIGLILALLMHQKWLREQEIAAEQEKALQALKQKNDEQEAYLNQLRNLLQKDPCAIEPGLSGITPPEGSALPTLQDRNGTGSPSASVMRNPRPPRLRRRRRLRQKKRQARQKRSPDPSLLSWNRTLSSSWPCRTGA